MTQSLTMHYYKTRTGFLYHVIIESFIKAGRLIIYYKKIAQVRRKSTLVFHESIRE